MPLSIQSSISVYFQVGEQKRPGRKEYFCRRISRSWQYRSFWQIKALAHWRPPRTGTNILSYMHISLSTVLVKSFAHLNRICFLASLEEIGKFWKWWTVYSGVLQLTHFWGMIICKVFWVTLVEVEACLKNKIAHGKCMESVWWNDTLS